MRRLHASGWNIHVLAMLEPVATYARELLGNDRVVFAPLLSDALKAIGPLLCLRRRRFDAVYIPFPATRWQYPAVAAIVGGKKTYLHRYGGVSSFIASLMGATEVALRGGHRVFENLRLIGEDIDQTEETYWLPDTWRLSRIPGLFGVHVGTMAYKGNEARRWPISKFREVVESIAASHETRVFFGPHEVAELEYFRSADIPNVTLVSASLREAARAVSECDVFLTNDNGFAHLASGLGVKTLALFGMTDPTRALPLGASSAIRTSSCKPCHDEGLRRFECALNLDYQCIKGDLPADIVIHRVHDAFSRVLPVSAFTSRGPFRLYGIGRS